MNHWRAACGESSQARFGGGLTEKARVCGTSLAAYPTLKASGEPRGSSLSHHCLIEGWELQVDHIIPRAPKDASNDPDIQVPNDLDHPSNLAAACPHCNRQKRDFVTGRSILFGGSHRLFNPRGDVWREHFAWSEDYQRILPLTAIGDATVQRLEMNARIFRRQRDLLRRAALAGGSRWP